MPEETNQHEPVQVGAPVPEDVVGADLLTVSQAYSYLMAQTLPRSKKTIRKWCRHNHVEWKEMAIPGGAKWLITRSSLDARIAEERLIGASLNPETGANLGEPGRTGTGPNPAPVRDEDLVQVLKEQLAHEREARRSAERQARELIDKYHEISLASARMGMEIGKGLQEQARTRRLAVRSESASPRSSDIAPATPVLEVHEAAVQRLAEHDSAWDGQEEVDNPDPGGEGHRL